MANDLQVTDSIITQVSANPQAILSLPRHIAWLCASLGTTQWPEQGIRYTLMAGVKISDAEMAQAKQHLQQIEAALNPDHPDRVKCSMVRLSLLTRMLMAYSVGAASEQASEAKIDAYREAVSDMPAWTIAEAVKRWNRGQCGDIGHGVNYAWAPAPAILRAICERQLDDYRATAAKLRRLIEAVPLERAMDPKPIEASGRPALPVLKRIK